MLRGARANQVKRGCEEPRRDAVPAVPASLPSTLTAQRRGAGPLQRCGRAGHPSEFGWPITPAARTLS
eukprot:436466-Prymnesium_polylepis.1